MREPEYYPFSCAPVFSMVMQDEDLCRRFLERVLGTEVGEIKYHAIEHEMSPALDARSVRLDAYLKSEGAVYDIELQASPERSLGRRLRYYQSVIDSSEAKAGDAFDALPESYVIFVCDHDPYGAAIPIYDLERACAQDASVEVGDGSHWRVLNALAWRDESDEGLRNLLNYVLSGEASDALTRELDAAVEGINSDPVRREAVSGFMTQERHWRNRMYLARKEGLEEGKAEGKAEGEARYAALVDRLLDEGRLDDLRQSSKDSRLLQELFAEYGL